MKNVLTNLLLKKSVLAIVTVCASATVAAAVIVPNITPNDESQQKNDVVAKNTKQLENKIDDSTEKEENSFVEDETTDLESSLDNSKPHGVIVDSNRVNSSTVTSNNSANESQAPKEESVSTSPEQNVPEMTEPEKETPSVSETPKEKEPSVSTVTEEKAPETTEPEKEAPSVSETSKEKEPSVSTEPEERAPEINEPEKEVPPVSDEQKEEETKDSTESQEQSPEVDQSEQQAPSTSDTPTEKEPSVSTEPEEKEPETTEPEKEVPPVSDEQKEEETKDSTESQEQIPEVDQTEEQNPSTQEVPSTEEKNNESNEYIEIIKKAVEKTRSVDSVYFTRRRTGIYPENSKVRYNKNQNRHWYIDGDIEEYLEGFPGRYTTEFNPVRYFYQTWWVRNTETKLWERRTPLHSVFGISELGFLTQIKSAEKLDIRCPYAVYTITLDKDFANKSAENLLNTTNMFNQDVEVTIMIDFDGYIRSIDCNWGKDVLNDQKLGPITITVHMGDFNSTNIDRPKDLKDSPIDYPDVRDELTQNKKENIKNSIYEAYKKTYNADNATYEVNGKKVEYDINSNSALIENNDGTVTYYDGADNKYVDHNYVTSEYQQDSWTKLKDSDTWVKNVRKHTCFIPRELYFLRLIFDVKSVETESDVTTYTIEVLKEYANQAYSYSYDTADNKFSSNVTFTVSLDKNGYVSEIHINSEGYKLDLIISNVNSTNVEKPEGIN